MAKNAPTNNLTTEAKNFFKNQLGVDIKTADEAINNDKVKKFIE